MTTMQSFWFLCQALLQSRIWPSVFHAVIALKDIKTNERDGMIDDCLGIFTQVDVRQSLSCQSL